MNEQEFRRALEDLDTYIDSTAFGELSEAIEKDLVDRDIEVTPATTEAMEYVAQTYLSLLAEFISLIAELSLEGERVRPNHCVQAGSKGKAVLRSIQALRVLRGFEGVEA